MTGRHIFSDQFTVALILAMGLHAAVLLVVSFVFDINPLQKAADTLDVILVNWRSEEVPEVAEFLAQASQTGGGESTELSRPSMNESSAIPSQGEGDMPEQVDSQLPADQENSLQEVIAESPVAQPVQQVTHIEQLEKDTPTAAELMQQSMEIASLQPDMQRETEWQSKLPRREFISANTREYEFASYMQAWVAKVERVGNLNYPMEVRRRKLVGNLLMTVGIRQDGSIESIEIAKSSGFQELDDAARRIVRLAAPYSPLPDNIRSKVDVLHITRTWKFSTGYRLE